VAFRKVYSSIGSIENSTDVDYYICNYAAETKIKQMARVTGKYGRFNRRSSSQAKKLTWLLYEVRLRKNWHFHITLSILKFILLEVDTKKQDQTANDPIKVPAATIPKKCAFIVDSFHACREQESTHQNHFAHDWKRLKKRGNGTSCLENIKHLPNSIIKEHGYMFGEKFTCVILINGNFIFFAFLSPINKIASFLLPSPLFLIFRA
jgi:hypothetical protein